VLLLEYVNGSRLGTRGRPAAAELQTVATLLRNLHIRAEGDYPDLWRHVKKRHSTIVTTRRLPAPARAIADEAHHALAELPRERFLLHGDLHAANIILTGDHAVVIDPYGLVGDRAYDVAFVAVTSPADQERVLATLGQCYGVALNGLTAWFRWLAVYRLDNAMRNGLPTIPIFQALVERLTHQPFRHDPPA
jgi:streptomycin 6-kinase